MPRFRKKPVEVEATQWFKNGDHPEDNCGTFTNAKGMVFQGEGQVVRFYQLADDDPDRECAHCGKVMHVHGWIETLEGGHVVCPADWIITGDQGERYPCKPDILAATYDDATADGPGGLVAELLSALKRMTAMGAAEWGEEDAEVQRADATIAKAEDKT